MKSKRTTAMPDLRTAAMDFLQKSAAGEVSEAFARYISPTFHHHNPFFRGDGNPIELFESGRRNGG